jgi:hypothetical protein
MARAKSWSCLLSEDLLAVENFLSPFDVNLFSVLRPPFGSPNVMHPNPPRERLLSYCKYILNQYFPEIALTQPSGPIIAFLCID